MQSKYNNLPKIMERCKKYALNTYKSLKEDAIGVSLKTSRVELVKEDLAKLATSRISVPEVYALSTLDNVTVARVMIYQFKCISELIRKIPDESVSAETKTVYFTEYDESSEMFSYALLVFSKIPGVKEHLANTNCLHLGSISKDVEQAYTLKLKMEHDEEYKDYFYEETEDDNDDN